MYILYVLYVYCALDASSVWVINAYLDVG